MVEAFTIVKRIPPIAPIRILDGPPKRYMKKRKENGVEMTAISAIGRLHRGIKPFNAVRLVIVR